MDLTNLAMTPECTALLVAQIRTFIAVALVMMGAGLLVVTGWYTIYKSSALKGPWMGLWLGLGMVLAGMNRFGALDKFTPTPFWLSLYVGLLLCLMALTIQIFTVRCAVWMLLSAFLGAALYLVLVLEPGIFQMCYWSQVELLGHI